MIHKTLNTYIKRTISSVSLPLGRYAMFSQTLRFLIGYLSRYSIMLLAEKPSPCRIKSCLYSANSTYRLWSLSRLLFRTPRTVFTLE